MSKISERLECYQTQMSIYAEQHKIILANDVLEMIEQLQEDLEDDIENVVTELKKLKVNADTTETIHHNLMIDICIDNVRKRGVT